MGIASNYWTLLRLEPTGTYRTLKQGTVEAFLQQQFTSPDPCTSLTDEVIQAQLFQIIQDGQSSIEHQQLATLSLRCFISHQIVQTCLSLVSQFGGFYRFGLADLLPLVLEDDGRLAWSEYPSLAQRILKTFQPGSGSLTNWITRLVRQHRELNQLLLEHGLYLVSDWAILNDTPIERLRRILQEVFSLTAAEVEQACQILDSYRAIYLPEHTHSKQCQPPTEDQLQRMSDRFQQRTGKPIRPTTFLQQLQSLAKRLRQHRITARTGRLPTQSTDDLATQTYVNRQVAHQAHDHDRVTHNRFLLQYRQVFETALDHALQTVVQDRIQKARKPETRDRFQKALQLFHCQQMSMGAIAVEVGLPRQDSVSHLLKLKDFRADVKHLMLRQLQRELMEVARHYQTCDDLTELSAEVEAALNEQITALMEVEAKRSKAPKEYMTDSIFSKRLCWYLDRLLSPP